ncbi:hypothetical protein N0V90_002539 [Kalmusia sp. IMI 367209]|nr:hypothetical protein N0V90_002539 [Kalmusia sp. IMI 367209]
MRPTGLKDTSSLSKTSRDPLFDYGMDSDDEDGGIALPADAEILESPFMSPSQQSAPSMPQRNLGQTGTSQSGTNTVLRAPKGPKGPKEQVLNLAEGNPEQILVLKVPKVLEHRPPG